MEDPVENYEEEQENYEGQEETYEEEEEQEETYEAQENENGDSHTFEEVEEEEEQEEEEEEEQEEQEEQEEEDPNNPQIEQEEIELEHEHIEQNMEETNVDNNNDINDMTLHDGGDNNGGEINIEKWKGWPGENAFRILVPGHKVGAVIGHKGDIIKKMAEETRARIRILNSPPGVQERVVLITSKEEPQLAVSPAMEGLFRVHRRIVDGLDPDSDPQPAGAAPPTRLLVPGVQAAMVIGKQGATIKLVQESSGAVVRVSENVPPIALYDDRIVEIQGEPASMHKALELISTYLRKFLIDRTVIPLFEAQMQQNLQNAQQHHELPPPAQQHHQWGPPPPQYSAGPGYAPAGPGYAPYPPPPDSSSSYYPPPSKQPSPYAAPPPPYSAPPPYAAPAPPAANQGGGGASVTQHMQVPLSYVDAVIGADGANISYIRRASGATVTVQETRGVPGEMTVEMVGSAAQVQTAQQLIQNFMAEAAPPGVGAPAASAAPATTASDPGYGSYGSYGSAYGTVPPGTGPADPAGGPPPYGSSYPTGYGY